jgi:hypothetical protein
MLNVAENSDYDLWLFTKVRIRMNRKNNKKIIKRSKGVISIPRPIQNVQPKQISKAVIPFKAAFQITGTAASYFGNYPIFNSLYNVLTGAVAILAGMDVLTTMYTAYTVTKSRIKLTLGNTKSQAVSAYLYPTVGPTAAGGLSILGGHRLPEAKTQILGSVIGANAIKTISHTSDVSKLVGYDVVGHYSFIALFGANPSIPTGYDLVYFSTDGVTLPVLDIKIEIDFEVTPVTAKKITF